MRSGAKAVGIQKMISETGTPWSKRDQRKKHLLMRRLIPREEKTRRMRELLRQMSGWSRFRSMIELARKIEVSRTTGGESSPSWERMPHPKVKAP